jgi:hypothetical protein
VYALKPETPEELLLEYVIAFATAGVGTYLSKVAKVRKLRKVLSASHKRLLEAARKPGLPSIKIGSLGEIAFEAHMRAEGAIVIQTQYGGQEIRGIGKVLEKGFDRGLIWPGGKNTRVVIAEVKHAGKAVSYDDLTALGSRYKTTLLKNKQVFIERIEETLKGERKLYPGMTAKDLEKHRLSLETALGKLRSDDFEIMIAVKDRTKADDALIDLLKSDFPGKKITIFKQEP